MGQFAHLEIDEHITFQDAIIEDQIHKKVFILVSQAFLPRYKSESFPKLQQKVLHLPDDGGFQVRFMQLRAVGKSQKIEDIGIFQRIGSEYGNETTQGWGKIP